MSTNVQIQVNLISDHEDTEEIKGFCAIVIDFNETSKVWYNTGLVYRDKSPILAFQGALELYKKYNTKSIK